MVRSLLRAPREDRATYCSPPIDDWPAALRANSARFHNAQSRIIGGTSLGELRRQARAEATQAAVEYLRSFDPTFAASPDANAPLVALGHQPDLFHPGVWIKSFAASRLAKEVSGVSLHILADADTTKQTAIYVPSGTLERPHATTIPFDRWTAEIPFEEVPIADDEVFSRFPRRVVEAMKDLPFRPIVEDYWRRVTSARRTTRNLGECLAAGRRSLENELGCHNLEVPLTRLCQTPSFQVLAADILVRIEEFRSIYNGALADYRRIRRVRSRNHPASDLAQRDGWSETPFWAWRTQSPRRDALWARTTGDGVEFRVDSQTVPWTPAQSRTLQEALSPWKLRPRALVTTLYARLLLADWFVHGIGGARYDEVTDEILRRFFAVEPPRFGVLTATVLLPGAQSDGINARLAKLARESRDVVWNPDRHLDDTLREREPLAHWIERKIALEQARPQRHLDRKARFHEFRDINRKIFPYVEGQWQSIEDERVRLAERARSADVLSSRELAFCLHPRETIEWLANQP